MKVKATERVATISQSLRLLLLTYFSNYYSYPSTHLKERKKKKLIVALMTSAKANNKFLKVAKVADIESKNARRINQTLNEIEKL